MFFYICIARINLISPLFVYTNWGFFIPIDRHRQYGCICLITLLTLLYGICSWLMRWYSVRDSSNVAYNKQRPAMINQNRPNAWPVIIIGYLTIIVLNWIL